MGGLLNKPSMYIPLLQTRAGWKPRPARVELSAGDKTAKRRPAFSGNLPKEPVLGFWILVNHHHVIRTPLYNEPRKEVKMNNYRIWKKIYDFDFLICTSGLGAMMAYGVTRIIIKINSLSLCGPSCPEEDKSISISARLNDWVPVNLYARDNSFVFKMAINCINTDRAAEKLRVLKCWS